MQMQMPRFTADASLYRTSRHYRAVAARASDFGGLAFPAIAKGIHCVSDPSCSTGFSQIFCPTFDPDSCQETGVCCTPPRPTPPPPSACPVGQQACTNEGVRGCCVAGAHCCNDDHGCCPNGQTCRSIFGIHFCDPIF